MKEKNTEIKQETNTETAEEKKGISLQVVASVFCKDDVVSFTIPFPLPDDRFVDKAIDVSQSLVHVHSQQQLFGKVEDYTCKLDKLYLNTYTVLLSGMLHLVDEPPRSAGEVAKAALELAVLRLLDKDDDLCAVCARQQQCKTESDEQDEAWQQPACTVCVDNVVQYFLEQVKK